MRFMGIGVGRRVGVGSRHRAEKFTHSYAGSSTRMDFLLCGSDSLAVRGTVHREALPRFSLRPARAFQSMAFEVGLVPKPERRYEIGWRGMRNPIRLGDRSETAEARRNQSRPQAGTWRISVFSRFRVT